VSLRGSYGVQLQPVKRATLSAPLRYFGLARQRQYLLSRKFSIIFMLRCDRVPVMLNLLTAVKDSNPEMPECGVRNFSIDSLQLRVLCLGFFENRDVGIGVLPDGEEILIGGTGGRDVSFENAGAGKA
jgi:hypothetical protein